ncbi:GAF domain-containing protein [Permianibacter sp. IMCC34836]|uniref:GAF domain-containing protein n=1 Tax=Permianibacter fluminis TaxID=2738515 RepID=UPI0015562830|nr:pyridoxamine 5'-phosphate oxidase family protein [Permianibacter fluminis]NQD36704.1 GAF domain-containing protein [Permianibacter fluminis]
MFPTAAALTVDSIRDCLEGFIPSAIATCAADGTPNVTYVSQVDYVDREHVALSFQFFNKTRENILANPYATVYVINPMTGQAYSLSLHYLRTEHSGRLFERMKVKLAGIAAHSGMTGIFKLQGADIYQVQAIEKVPVAALPPMPPRALLTALRHGCEQLQQCNDVACLLDETLALLACGFGIEQSMILLVDEVGKRLYTVASHGYAAAGIGWEIPVGEGLIGLAAAHHIPVRIAFKTSEYAYGQAIRQNLTEAGRGNELAAEIPFPGLPASESQMAIPILSGTQLLGVLFVESEQPCRFSYDDEDALVTLTRQLGMLLQQILQAGCDETDPASIPNAAELATASKATGAENSAATPGVPVVLQHYPENDIIFLDDNYLIKGVAGAILWKLVSCHQSSGRDEFSNRELRLDPAIGLPELSDNLEARLILLARRLAERCDYLAIEKTGRGRFRLRVDRPLQLRSGH